ncbi:hypothetical protein PHO31112_02551 [Pandoraea horticolens]|uniref:Uncharacterized protein n=1 Tax=Pandoraea horticolens TaxID=2508298 RepID=A0A5E4VB43_9BURK|nr:hypothetical protein PHO31112_02551 [Pandoraea horticolens]
MERSQGIGDLRCPEVGGGDTGVGGSGGGVPLLRRGVDSHGYPVHPQRFTWNRFTDASMFVLGHRPGGDCRCPDGATFKWSAVRVSAISAARKRERATPVLGEVVVECRCCDEVAVPTGSPFISNVSRETHLPMLRWLYSDAELAEIVGALTERLSSGAQSGYRRSSLPGSGRGRRRCWGKWWWSAVAVTRWRCPRVAHSSPTFHVKHTYRCFDGCTGAIDPAIFVARKWERATPVFGEAVVECRRSDEVESADNSSALNVSRETVPKTVLFHARST